MKLLSKIIISGTALLILLTIVAGAYKYFYVHDYYSIVDISCDPEIDDCFAAEEDGELAYYKVLKFYAANAPACDLTDPTCYEEMCIDPAAQCEIITCAMETEFSERFELCSE